MELGMLYNCRSDEIVPGIKLWNDEKLRGNRNSAYRPFQNTDVTAEDLVKSRGHVMKIEAELQMSFLAGKVKVSGAASYLNTQRSSCHHSRFILTYTSKTWFEELTMTHLAMKNIDHKDIFDNQMATHVVTAVEYGADAVFAFEREVSEYEDKRNIEGKFKAIIDLVTTKLEGGAELQMTDEEKEFVDKFKFKFYGDIDADVSAENFKEAMRVFRSLSGLIKQVKNKADDTIYGVPKKVYLFPLSKLDRKAAKLVRMISANVINEVESLMEAYESIQLETIDLEASKPCFHFFDFRQQIRKFRSLIQQFQSEFQQILAVILPEIRGGGAEEAVLLGKIRKIKRSPYDVEKLGTWLDVRRREIATLKSYLKSIESTKMIKLAFQPGELQTYTQDTSLKNVLCFSFGGIGSMDDPFLTKMSNFAVSDPNEKSGMENWAQIASSWCDDEDITYKIQQQLRLFCEFAMANSEDKNLRSIAVAKSSSGKMKDGEEPGNIYLFVNGRKELVEICSAPIHVKAISVEGKKARIRYDAPIVGVGSVICYEIQYRELQTNPEIEKEEERRENPWLSNRTDETTTDCWVTNLAPMTEYEIRVLAITKCGHSPSSEMIQIKTCLNWSILPQPDTSNARAFQVSAKGNELWMTDDNQSIFRWDGTKWENKYGLAVRVGASPDGYTWAVNADDNIYRYVLGTPPGAPCFAIVPGELVQINAISKDLAVGVNRIGEVYLWRKDHWNHIWINCVCAAIGEDEEIWAVSKNPAPENPGAGYEIFRWENPEKGFGGWVKQPCVGVEIDVVSKSRIIYRTKSGHVCIWYTLSLLGGVVRVGGSKSFDAKATSATMGDSFFAIVEDGRVKVWNF